MGSVNFPTFFTKRVSRISGFQDICILWHNNIKFIVVFMLAILFTTALPREAMAQYELPVITNERGDTIHYTWPLPDSALCIKDEIIIKFKLEALFLNKLCFNFTVGPPAILNPSEDWYYQQKSIMMSQEFPIDTLIVDPALREAIRSFGGMYLTRITSANPCTDTFSVTRFGDTIKSTDYLWMLLKLNNDTSVINACIGLTIAFQNLLDGAEPNYCLELFFNPPNPDEPYYHSRQQSLWPGWTNVEPAWIMQTGSPDIRVGIIDEGIYYKHPDLGAGFGPGYKVAGGWNYFENIWDIGNGITAHGTKIAGIIGGITNGPYPIFGVTSPQCNPEPSTGIAGIAGGWWPNNLGCTLFGYKIADDILKNRINSDYAIGAIRDASRKTSNSGDSIHILNCSWGLQQTDSIIYYSESLRSAFNYAYENGVSIIAARGNEGQDNIAYPACYDPTWITSVGGVGNSPGSGLPLHSRTDWRDSAYITSYGHNMDLLAPAINFIIFTTSYCLLGFPPLMPSWSNFDGTSAAAPHVAGAIALLRSEFLEHPERFIPLEENDKGPEPEDYENMLKASARDLNYGLDPALARLKPPIYSYTLQGYDTTTGWGELDIGKVFMMLQNGYVLKHYIIDNWIGGVYGDYIDLDIRKEGKREDCPPGLYNAKRREVTGQLNLENYWIMTEETPLYVWGRNGRSATKGGFGASNPLYLTSYTEVTNGTRGNDIVPGILHDYYLSGLTVNAKTYQYQLYTLSDPPQYIQDLPINANMKLYISVFGKRDLSDVKEPASKSMTIFPNPATNTITVKFNLDIPTAPIIKIHNELGMVVYEEQSEILMPGNYGRVIDVSTLPAGIYLIEINQGIKQNINKLIINK